MSNTRISKRKLRAGSLQFVLFTGAVIAVLLLTFVLLSHSHFLFAKKTDKYVELIKQTDRAIQFSLNANRTLNQRQDSQFESEGIITSVRKKHWGVYNILNATSSFQKSKFDKTVLTGGKSLNPNTALFLKDNNRPMVIVGQSKITGDAYLPKQGIRTGNIGGNSFHGKITVQGRKALSASKLPQMEFEQLNAMLKLLETGDERTKYLSPTIQQSEIVNSFAGPTLTINADATDLSRKKIAGNIVIRSNYEIHIDALTQLTDVIVVAPKISIGNGVRGNFQAIASKAIEVGENCHLEYPSALVVLQKNTPLSTNKTNINLPEINLLQNSVVQGVVAYFTAGTQQVYYPQIKIEKSATVIGQVYCQNNIELKGNVLGNVTTSQFVSLENGNVYQNHLYNGSIDATVLPFQYVGLDFDTNTKKGVVKCLY